MQVVEGVVQEEEGGGMGAAAEIHTMIRTLSPNQEAGGETPRTFTEDEGGRFINSAPKDPNRLTSPALSAWLFPNLRVGPPTRNTAAVGLFTNAIPTIEMSLSVPYINMFFVASVIPSLGERTKQLSLLRFLGMNANDTLASIATGGGHDKVGMRSALRVAAVGGMEGRIITDATGLGGGFSQWGESVSTSGMELFTSSQMLVNANINGTGRDSEGGIFKNFSGMSGGVLDPMQPLLTLDSISINVKGLGQALLANRTATISFTLHDRSRMSDIAPLISADLFGTTYIMLEYGWMHPNDSMWSTPLGPSRSASESSNVYGTLINSMRTKGIFNIMSSNFTIGNDGQVKVRMELASRGGADARSLPIGVGDVVPAAPLKSMLSASLKRLLIAHPPPGPGVADADATAMREIRQRISVSLDAANSSSSVVPRSLWTRYLTLLSSGNETDSGVLELRSIIEDLIGDPTVEGDGGMILESGTSLIREVTARSLALKDQPDAFRKSILPIQFQESQAAADEAEEQHGGAKISLGKILLAFVGRPLAASGRYDEVQMMFYRFNGRSMAARKYDTIANFIVDFAWFHAKILQYVKSFPGMSIEGFVNMINGEFVNDPTNINYGFEFATRNRALSESEEEDLADAPEAEQRAHQAETRAISDTVEQAIIKEYTEGGEPIFVVPRVVTYFETIPAYSVQSDDSFVVDPAKTILRIHVFDANATPHDDQRFILAAMNDSEMAIKLKGSVSAAESGESPLPNGTNTTMSDGLEERGALVSNAANNRTKYLQYTTNISNADIKNILKSSVPSMTFGSQFSAMQSVSLSSNTSGGVNNVLLLNAISGNNQVQPGASNDLEEVKVIPASARVTLLGCPIVEYGQQFFVDMGTGTTADNLYRVTGISHTISAGRFETAIDLTFVSNGTMSTFRGILSATIPRLMEIEQAQSPVD